MTTQLLAVRTAAVAEWRGASRARRVTAFVGLALLLVGLVHALLWGVLGGPATGPLSWRKPTTFGLSFGLTTMTLAWVAGYLALPRRFEAVALGALAVANTYEVAWVAVQHARGVPSHFAMAPALDAMLFSLGGFAVAVTVAVAALFAVRACWPTTPAASMRLALRVGLVVLLASMAAGVWMIVRGAVLGLPPSTVGEGGSIKVLHGVGMHGIQATAVLAWLVALLPLQERTRVRRVALASAGYVVLLAATAALAVTGTSLLTPLGLLAGAIGLAAVGAAWGRTALDLLADGRGPEPGARLPRQLRRRARARTTT